jgi:3-dehydroquinate synthase
MKEIKSDGYSVHISNGIYPEINKFFKASGKRYSRIFILVDENSLRYCYPQLVANVPAFKDAELIEIESGEESKTIEVCTQIWGALSEYGADRKSLFVNVGGGVIGDMGGFIASTFKRGIEFMNIPTTLLSQVDASIGGKTGIDLNNLKNEIGVFNTPAAVFIDPDFLATLPQRHLISGFAEMVKHALISDAEYWNLLKETDPSDSVGLTGQIRSSVIIKNRIVLDDPKEQGGRKMLNFGHTIGHAIETFALESDQKHNLLHGEAVAAGMVCEAWLSNSAGKLNAASLKEVTEYLLKTFPHVELGQMDHHRLIELMKHDKKNLKGDISFSLLTSIGSCEINRSAKADQIREALRYYSDQVKISK